ncbi:hypothetical protein [uncultured Bacteroides sp.]|uniref:hypothetical protein n=1 Tax=uncultured Bacteroides sp. TaxID=162156 RepID=UPI0025E50945|nr:hypothetical protein [uncultured Bacteroides sp.]
MKRFLIFIFLCLPLLLCAQSGPTVNITGSYTAVLYDPYTPPITAELDNRMSLNALSGFIHIVMDVPDSSLHYEWEAYSSDGSEVSLQYSGLHNERYLNLNGTPRSVTIRVLLKKDTDPNYVVNYRSFTFTTYRYP